MLAQLKKPQEADLTTYIESLNYAEIIQRGLLPKNTILIVYSKIILSFTNH